MFVCFFPFETGSLKPHNTDTIQNDKKKKWLQAKQRGVLGIVTMLRTSLATLVLVEDSWSNEL